MSRYETMVLNSEIPNTKKKINYICPTPCLASKAIGTNGLLDNRFAVESSISTEIYRVFFRGGVLFKHLTIFVQLQVTSELEGTETPLRMT